MRKRKKEERKEEEEEEEVGEAVAVRHRKGNNGVSFIDYSVCSHSCLPGLGKEGPLEPSN